MPDLSAPIHDKPAIVIDQLPKHDGTLASLALDSPQITCAIRGMCLRAEGVSTGRHDKPMETGVLFCHFLVGFKLGWGGRRPVGNVPGIRLGSLPSLFIYYFINKVP